jgi:hypothetical protein
MASVAPAQLFVHSLAERCPEARGQLILGVAGGGDTAEPLAGAPVRRLRKPFNLRDLHAMAEEVFASSQPRSPVATEAH